MEPLEEAELNRAVVFVHVLGRWTEYGTLLPLTAPFAEGDLVLVYSRGDETNARIASQFPGWEILHYYRDTPDTFYPEPRATTYIEN